MVGPKKILKELEKFHPKTRIEKILKLLASLDKKNETHKKFAEMLKKKLVDARIEAMSMRDEAGGLEGRFANNHQTAPRPRVEEKREALERVVEKETESKEDNNMGREGENLYSSQKFNKTYDTLYGGESENGYKKAEIPTTFEQESILTSEAHLKKMRKYTQNE